MPMIKSITSTFERAIASFAQSRERAEMERRTELQYAREMRNRSLPGSADFHYYNTIVNRCGGR